MTSLPVPFPVLQRFHIRVHFRIERTHSSGEACGLPISEPARSSVSQAGTIPPKPFRTSEPHAPPAWTPMIQTESHASKPAYR